MKLGDKVTLVSSEKLFELLQNKREGSMAHVIEEERKLIAESIGGTTGEVVKYYDSLKSFEYIQDCCDMSSVFLPFDAVEIVHENEKEIEIQVIGLSATGKTTIISLISQMLLSAADDIEIKTENVDDGISKRLELINNKRSILEGCKITIKEVNKVNKF